MLIFLALLIFVVGITYWVKLERAPFRPQTRDYILLFLLFSAPFLLVFAWVPVYVVYHHGKKKPVAPEGHDAGGYRYGHERVVPAGYDIGERRPILREWDDEEVSAGSIFNEDILNDPACNSIPGNIHHVD